MPDPKSSGTGYFFYKNLVNTMGEANALAYIDKLEYNVKQFSESGSGPIKLLIQGEIGIGLGLTFQAVNQINEGSPFQIVYPKEGSPYSLTGTGMMKHSSNDADVQRVFDFIINDFLLYDKEHFSPEQILQHQKNTIPNYPKHIPYADMTGIEDIHEKERLLEVLKDAKLIVKDLYKNFDGKDILKHISFAVKEGEFLSVLGPSGCGKTTLLRILIGLEKQDDGEILLDAQDISHLKPSERGMGIIFQNYALFPNMSVLENVEYALKLRADLKQNSRKIALSTLEAIGMLDQIDKRPSQLSGGQQQRVAIARTLALNPKIILLDEPISALDVSMREVMKKELKDIQKKFNSTMIFITHEQEEAFYLSDRIMVMSEGNIEQIDTPRNIYEHPANDYIKDFVIAHLDSKLASLCVCTGKNVYEK